MEWSEGDLVWFDPGLGHPLPGEILEAHRAAQVLIVQALINGKVICLSFQLTKLFRMDVLKSIENYIHLLRIINIIYELII